MAKIRKKQKNADYGRVLVDEQLETLEKDISRVYSDAVKDVKQKFDNYTEKFKDKDSEMRSRVSEGLISENQYNSWRAGQMFQKGKYEAQLDDLTESLTNADKTAMAMVRDQLPETYATSYNFGGYRGETYANAAGIDYTSFTIYNKNTVKTLMKDNPDLIPWKTEPDIPKAKRWNRQHLQSAITQGVLQGESMDKIADRLLPIVKMDENAAIRTARTAVNGVENKARKDSVEALREDGVPMVESWSCTFDSRTRESHIELDGEQPDEDGYFANGCRYPGDPEGEPSEIYNCRCSLLSFLEGIDHSKDEDLYEKMMQEEYYDDWLANKEKEEPELPYPIASNTKEAVDILHDMGFDKVSSGVEKIDEEIFVDSVNQLSMLNDKFGANIEGMNVNTGYMNAMAYAKYNTINGDPMELKLSTKYFNGDPASLTDTMKNAKNSGWFMPFDKDNKNVYTVTHEYGHILQNSIVYNDKYQSGLRDLVAMESPDNKSKFIEYARDNAYSVKDSMRKEIIGIAKDRNPDFDVTLHISEYGKTNSEEFFAEVFANSQCGKPNELGDAMNEWLRRKGYDT